MRRMRTSITYKMRNINISDYVCMRQSVSECRES